MTTDGMALAHVLEDAGIQREGAEKVASAIFDAIHDNVATKTDVAAVRADVLTRLADLEPSHDAPSVSALVVAVGIILTALRFLGHG